MSEDIAKVFAYSKKHRNVALNGVIRLEENIDDLEEKLALTDGKRVTLEYVANKLQMFDAEFHEHHYKSIDPINDSVELKALQKILDDHERRNIDFFTSITNIRCREKTVTPLPKPAEETIYVGAYNSHLQLLGHASLTRVSTRRKSRL